MVKRMKNKGRKKTLNRRQMILIAGGIVLLAILISVFVRIGWNGMSGKLTRDPMAVGGLLPGKTAEEIEALLKTKVEEGRVNIGVAAEPIFQQQGKKGRLAIENIPANHYTFQVDLFLEDGELIYQSGLVDPGYYIEFVGLEQKLPAGEYNAKAVVTAYTMDRAQSQISESQVKVKLHVIEGIYYH